MCIGIRPSLRNYFFLPLVFAGAKEDKRREKAMREGMMNLQYMVAG